MAAETQYTAITGMTTVDTANSNLDGTGDGIMTVLYADSKDLLIKTITVQAITSTDDGVVRLFLYNGTSIKLLKEIEISAVTKSATAKAFSVTIPLYMTLPSGWYLKASTQNSETFNVIAEAQYWDYYSTSVRADTTEYTVGTGAITISSANSNLDGTGAMETVVTSSGGNLSSITIIATETTEAGIVRLFIYDGTNTKLFREIEVPAVTQSGTEKAFYHRIFFEDMFALKSGWSFKASTEKENTFNVIADILNWDYPA